MNKQKFNPVLQEENKIKIYLSSNLEGERSLTILSLNDSDSGYCFNKLDIVFRCPSMSSGDNLNSQMPKCLEEINLEAKKSASLEMSILSSLTANKKISPFLTLLGTHLTSYPILDKNENTPLCTFSSNKNFILCSYQSNSPSCQISSKLQSRLNMPLSEGGVSFNNFFGVASSLKHFKDYGNHNSGAFKNRFPMTDFIICNNIIINLDSHNRNREKEVFKDYDEFLEKDISKEVIMYETFL